MAKKPPPPPPTHQNPPPPPARGGGVNPYGQKRPFFLTNSLRSKSRLCFNSITLSTLRKMITNIFDEHNWECWWPPYYGVKHTSHTHSPLITSLIWCRFYTVLCHLGHFILSWVLTLLSVLQRDAPVGPEKHFAGKYHVSQKCLGWWPCRQWFP